MKELSITDGAQCLWCSAKQQGESAVAVLAMPTLSTKDLVFPILPWVLMVPVSVWEQHQSFQMAFSSKMQLAFKSRAHPPTYRFTDKFNCELLPNCHLLNL